MTTISLDQIKSIRAKTGVSMQACKVALEEAQGDEEKAIELLRKKGVAKAAERSERTTGEGCVASYIHSNGKVGVLLQLGCETDFVARSEDFVTLAKDLAMHVAGLSPLYVSPTDVSEELVAKERVIWLDSLAKEGKPEAMHAKIMEGKEKKFREEVSLMTQPFVKNDEVKVEKLISDMVLKLGENIRVVRFTRFSF